MVELIVGLVAVLALFAGLLQIASLSRAHTEALVEARREAGALAMLDADVFALPEYIQDWEEGPDGKRHTRDDVFRAADPAAFQGIVVERAAEDEEAWEVLDRVPENAVSSLHGSAIPAADFGFVRGYDSRRVGLITAVQSLLYRAPSITVEAEVWMTQTKRIY